MDRRQFLVGATALAGVAGFGGAAQAQAGPEDAKLRALMDQLWEEALDEAPQTATILGLDVGPRAAQRGKLNDYSRAGRTKWVADTRSALARIKAIDRTKLNADSQVDYDVAAYTFETRLAGAERFPFGESPGADGYAPYSPYVISQLSGAYQGIPDFLDSTQPVKTREDAEAYLSRLEAFAGALDADTSGLRADAARAVLAPDFALDGALAQMDKLRGPAPGANGLATSLSKRATAAGVAGDWNARAAAIVAQKVYPALDRQRAAVAELRRKAKPDAGVWKIPDGDAFYAGALAFQTTTKLTPDEVHQIGLRQVAEITAQLDPMLKAQGLTKGTVGERLAELGRRPEQLYPNTDAGRAELLAALNVQTEAMRAKMPRAFKTLPSAKIEIVRVPPAIEDGAPNGYASFPSLDGTRPGRFYINLKDTAEWPKFTLPTLVYHEALPGHGWHGAILLGATEIPMIRRVGMGSAAYSEGWGLYAEQLADELGAYEGDPTGKMGYLQSLMFRAVRLVVDTGLHSKRWTRVQATDYFVQTTGYQRSRVQREVDRYCIWPGQACSYKVGHNEWVRLREASRAKKGQAFDIRDFHEVLRKGGMPLVVLERVVMAG